MRGGKVEAWRRRRGLSLCVMMMRDKWRRWERKPQPVVSAIFIAQRLHFSSSSLFYTHTTKLVFLFFDYWSSRQVNDWGWNRVIISCSSLSLSIFLSQELKNVILKQKLWWERNTYRSKKKENAKYTHSTKRMKFRKANKCWEMGSIPPCIPWGSVYTFIYISVLVYMVSSKHPRMSFFFFPYS